MYNLCGGVPAMRLLRCSIVLFVGLLGVPGGMLSAWAQGAPTVFIYDSIGGTSKTRAGVWGNGAADRSQSVTYEGSATLEVTTRNFNEGARFDLATPIDLAPYRQAGLLRLFLRFRPAQAAPGLDMGGGMPGTGGPPGWHPGMGGPPGRGGARA